MRLEALRLVTAWLNDDTSGVNAQLASVPRNGGDALPADFALIADSTEWSWAAMGIRPDVEGFTPCLLLRAGRSAQLDAHSHVGKRDGVVEILIAYHDTNSNIINALRDAEYRLRALERSIDDLFTVATAADRLMDSVAIWYLESALEVETPFVPLDDKTIAGGLRLTLKMRDTAP